MTVSTKVEAPNPLEEGLRRRRTPEPCALTIFGASGDLTQRKLFPALYALAVRNLLPPQFGVVGVARTAMTDEEFREKMKQAIQDHARDDGDPVPPRRLAKRVDLRPVSRLGEIAERVACPVARDGQFRRDEWGGANEIHVLGPDRVGVLGHIAWRDSAGDRHYHPVAFDIDLARGAVSPMKVLLERSDLGAGAAKRPDLADVVFSGGLVRHRDGTATLYVGAGDVEVHQARIADPF